MNSMKLKQMLIICSTIITMTACGYWFFFTNSKVTETITYFPKDTDARFLDAKSNITNVKFNQNQFNFSIKTYSRLDRPAYLRHDIALIFTNGKLIGKIGKWKENVDIIHMEKTFQGESNQLVRLISFHHAELHQSQFITSSQKMSDDYLYIIPTALPSPVTFHMPNGEDEIGWKEVLDRNEQKVMMTNVKEAAKKYNINLIEYQMIPLSKLISYQNQPLPGFSKEKSDEIIGQLWEGLYKNYFLGIQKDDGQIVSSIGSTLPVILIAKNKSHLFIVSQTAGLDIIALKQVITN